ncbi:13472_t:CDS:2 [Racocetra fulgida]|uniref:13472_t:CDS:1 n=1 Tax=Racocetra fulgida TaxID=60492 RepID=A0A9N8W4Y7_9GLOM|nr:13472_t:CDS:2 [Racocetra fulgida]
MIATSRMEFVNGYLKWLLHNSNASLCDLMTEIHRLLDQQDKENEYNFWKLSIPTKRDFREESLTVLKQKLAYGKVHSAYKKALCKALQTNSKSQRLIALLQEFAEENSSEQSDSDESSESNGNDEKNDFAISQLKNPKNRHGKG